MDNYTGPYWSNGRFQSSVEFGDAPPIDDVGVQSRLHDTAFAHFGDARHRTAADWIYYQNLQKVPGVKSSVVRALPFYGNLASAGHVSGLFSPLSPIAVFDYLLRVHRTSKEIKSGGYAKEIADVLNLYKTDPYKMGLAASVPIMYQQLRGSRKEQPADWLNPPGPISGDVGQLPKQAWPDNPSQEVPGTDLTPIQEVTIDANGNISPRKPVSAAPPPVSMGDIANAATMLGKENLDFLANKEEGHMFNTIVYRPYRPLKRKRYRITQRMVDVHNKYHGTHYTLQEVQAITGGYT